MSAVVVLGLAAFGSGALAGPVAFDLDGLDADGLYGPSGGRRALDYEYCIPAGAGYRQQVAAIDPSARFYPASRGRSGCTRGQVLVLGNSHRPAFRQSLRALAELPFVGTIREAVFE